MPQPEYFLRPVDTKIYSRKCIALHRHYTTFTAGCRTSSLNGLSGIWYKSHDFKGFGGPVETTGLAKKSIRLDSRRRTGFP